MKRLLFTFCFLVSVLVSSGQSASPFRQFFFNPYLYNPGFVGVNGTSEIYLAYRKQWVNFNDGPTTMGLSLQYPTHKRVALGLNVTSDEVVALRNTTALLTFAYVLPLAEDQTLRFGISGGFGNNNLNLKEGEYDPNDPVILNAAQNNFYADGNFGAVYTFKGLRVGFSLPQIFKTNRFTSEDFSEVKVSATDNQFYSVSYKFPIGSSLALEPYVLYNNRVDGQNSWEAASLVHIKENLWAGASYHQTNGLGFFFGMNVKNLLRFSYSYELPPVSSTFINSSSHELQLSLRLGKKRDPILTKKAAKTQQQALAKEEKSATPKEEPVVEEDASKNTRTTNTQTSVDNAVNEPVVAENTEQVQPINAETADNTVANSENTEVKTVRKTGKPPMSFTLARGHYVVVGAFKIMDNALKYSMEFQRKGIADPMVAISPKNGLYYVYIFSTYDLEEARRERNQYRLKRFFSEAWVLTID